MCTTSSSGLQQPWCFLEALPDLDWRCSGGRMGENFGISATGNWGHAKMSHVQKPVMNLEMLVKNMLRMDSQFMDYDYCMIISNILDGIKSPTITTNRCLEHCSAIVRKLIGIYQQKGLQWDSKQETILAEKILYKCSQSSSIRWLSSHCSWPSSVTDHCVLPVPCAWCLKWCIAPNGCLNRDNDHPPVDLGCSTFPNKLTCKNTGSLWVYLNVQANPSTHRPSRDLS